MQAALYESMNEYYRDNAQSEKEEKKIEGNPMVEENK